MGKIWPIFQVLPVRALWHYRSTQQALVDDIQSFGRMPKRNRGTSADDRAETKLARRYQNLQQRDPLPEHVLQTLSVLGVSAASGLTDDASQRAAAGSASADASVVAAATTNPMPQRGTVRADGSDVSQLAELTSTQQGFSFFVCWEYFLCARRL